MLTCFISSFMQFPSAVAEASKMSQRNERSGRPFFMTDQPESHAKTKTWNRIFLSSFIKFLFGSFRGEVKIVSSNHIHRLGQSSLLLDQTLNTKLERILGSTCFLKSFSKFYFSSYRGEVLKYLSQSEARVTMLDDRLTRKTQT